MIVADYTCEPCALTFEGTVESPAPDWVTCPVCEGNAAWTPTTLHGRVKRVEVVRGGWAKPEHPGWLDTRELGEGQPLEEFQAKRRAIRDVERKAMVRAMARGDL